MKIISVTLYLFCCAGYFLKKRPPVKEPARSKAKKSTNTKHQEFDFKTDAEQRFQRRSRKHLQDCKNNKHISNSKTSKQASDTKTRAMKAQAEARKQATVIDDEDDDDAYDYDDEAKKQKANDAAKKKEADNAAKKKEADDAAKKKETDYAANKKKADDAAKKKEADDAAKKKKADDAAKKKKADDAAKKKKADDAAKKKKADDAAKKKKSKGSWFGSLLGGSDGEEGDEEDDGGYLPAGSDSIVDTEYCDIERVPLSEITSKKWQDEFHLKQPVIITGDLATSRIYMYMPACVTQCHHAHNPRATTLTRRCDGEVAQRKAKRG